MIPQTLLVNKDVGWCNDSLDLPVSNKPKNMILPTIGRKKKPKLLRWKNERREMTKGKRKRVFLKGTCLRENKNFATSRIMNLSVYYGPP